MKNIIYDVAIIGAGLSGLAAANEFINTNYTVALIDAENIGGSSADRIAADNLKSESDVLVKWLTEVSIKLTTEDYSSNIDFYKQQVDSFGYRRGIFTLIFSNNERVVAKSIILATGIKKKKLEIDSVKVHYNLGDPRDMLNKTAAVACYTNEGYLYAEELVKYCKSLIVLDFTNNYVPTSAKIDVVKNIKSCSYRLDSAGRVFLLNVTNDLASDLLRVGELFVATPVNSTLSRFSNYIAIGENMRAITDEEHQSTKVPGIFAAGECRSDYNNQVLKLADGVTAAINVKTYLAKLC